MLRKSVLLTLVVLSSALLVGQAAGAETYSYLYAFGELGKNEGQFQYPVGVAIDADNNIYVTDWKNDNIQKFSASGTFLKRFGQDGKESWIRKPVGIAIYGDVIYVAEMGNHTIWMFSREGTFKGKFGSIGRNTGQFLYPRGVAVDSRGNVYVAGFQNGRVQVFSPTGQYIRQVVYKDSASGRAFNPRGVFVDDDDYLYVSFTNENSIAKYDPEFNFQFLFGKEGAGPGQLQGPRYLAEDTDGNLYISDYDNHRIHQFSADGNAGPSFGSKGSGPGQLNHPEGLAFDALGNLYVADAENKRVVVFAPPPRIRHRNQARIMKQEGNVEGTLKEYLTLLDLDPLNKEANRYIVDHYTARADEAFERKNWDEAERYYRKLQEYAPEKKDYIEEQLGKIKILRYLWMYVGIGAGLVLFIILLFAVRRGAPRKRRPSAE